MGRSVVSFISSQILIHRRQYLTKVFLMAVLALLSAPGTPVLLHAQPREMRLEGEPTRVPREIVAVRDGDGRFCAAIKVISTLGEGFTYDANNGVVRVDDRPGEDIVYLTAATKYSRWSNQVLDLIKLG